MPIEEIIYCGKPEKNPMARVKKRFLGKLILSEDKNLGIITGFEQLGYRVEWLSRPSSIGTWDTLLFFGEVEKMIHNLEEYRHYANV